MSRHEAAAPSALGNQVPRKASARAVSAGSKPMPILRDTSSILP